MLRSKILIIDDEEVNVRLLKRILQHAGFENLSSTTDSRVTAAFFQEVRPDLVLTDWLMPHLEGSVVVGQLCRLIARDDYLPIVVLTADVTPQAKRQALASGAMDFLTKPFDAVEVTLRIGNLLQARWSHLKILEQNAALARTVLELEAARDAALLATKELAANTVNLERSNADLEQFASVASHDLQEPLRAMAGCVQVLERKYRGKLDPAADELIRMIVNGSSRMKGLIDDLLAYSRSGQGDRLELVDSGTALQNALANLESAVTESHAEITFKNLPLVRFHPIALEQVFQNLVGNAIKYRSALPPEIHVGAERQGEGWRFQVADNGIGFEPEFSDKIFGIFQRLHAREQYLGTGIGLAIVRRIVERRGGKVWAESVPAQGSTFFFSVPD